MLLSVPQKMTILHVLEDDLARLDLEKYPRLSTTGIDDSAFRKWLDDLASLLADSSVAGQVCVISASIQPSDCFITVAFNRPPLKEDGEDQPCEEKLLHEIWKWMKEAAIMPPNNAEKNLELAEIVWKYSAHTAGFHVKEEGSLVRTLWDVVRHNSIKSRS
jgi:hypothetical protein